MAIRERHPELQKLYDMGKNVSSYSKLTTIHNCPAEAFQTYIKKLVQSPNIYGIAGGKIHDTLESIINGKCTEEVLEEVLKEELSDYDMLGLSFPKDRQGGDSIKESWVKNMMHFCKNFKKPNGKFITEEFLILKLDEDNYIQGYCDLIEIVDEEKKICNIFDWKTSSQFTRENLVEHGRQLVIYAMAMEQRGWTVNSIAWYMLKYCRVDFMGKKRANSKSDTEISIVCERRKICKEIKRHVIDKLINIGYDLEDAESIIEPLVARNDIESINELLGGAFVVSDYIRYYDLTDEARKECLDFALTTIKYWNSLNGKESSYPHRDFYKASKTGKLNEDTFFCAFLCGHSKHCPHYQKFLATKTALNSMNDDFDLFS